MSKVNISSSLKSDKENHIFKGKGIKRDNKIIYLDENVQTIVTLDNIITIERKSDYELKLNLKNGINLKGTYKTKYGTFETKTLTKYQKQTENELEIIYQLFIDDTLIDTFTYKLKISLDT